MSYLLCNGQEQQNTAPAEMWFLVSQEGLGTGEVNSCGEVVGTEPVHTVSWLPGFPRARKQHPAQQEVTDKEKREDDLNRSRRREASRNIS